MEPREDGCKRVCRRECHRARVQRHCGAGLCREKLQVRQDGLRRLCPQGRGDPLPQWRRCTFNAMLVPTFGWTRLPQRQGESGKGFPGSCSRRCAPERAVRPGEVSLEHTSRDLAWVQPVAPLRRDGKRTRAAAWQQASAALPTSGSHFARHRTRQQLDAAAGRGRHARCGSAHGRTRMRAQTWRHFVHSGALGACGGHPR
mmetsp:Transcript_2470/g.9828  ORF Transcript_2470/g.9828 Transcript_2470/m.9828 type:complete len:201 (-) Transcript_2470:287-889(-)